MWLRLKETSGLVISSVFSGTKYGLCIQKPEDVKFALIYFVLFLHAAQIPVVQMMGTAWEKRAKAAALGYIRRKRPGEPNGKHLERLWETARLPSAGSRGGRELSTAWSIIWSNGGPSVGNKSPRLLFCVGSSDDWPTFVPCRRSQLKVPSVRRREPRRETDAPTLALQFTVMGVVVVFFCFYFLLLSLSCRHARILKAITPVCAVNFLLFGFQAKFLHFSTRKQNIFGKYEPHQTFMKLNMKLQQRLCVAY